MGYEIIWEARGVVKQFSGHVTGKQLLQAGLVTEADSRFDGLRYVINDFLDSTGFSITAEDVDEIVAIDEAASRTNKAISIAVVATHPDIVDLANQYADSPMNVYPTRVFPTLAGAREWLGVSALTIGRDFPLAVAPSD